VDLRTRLLALGMLAFILCAPIVDREYEAGLIFSFTGILGAAILLLRYKTVLLYLLAFAIPISTSVQVFSGSSLSMPSELISFLFCIYFFLKLLTGKRLPKQFLRHPITILLMLDLLWLFISSAASELPLVSFKRFIIRGSYAITFYYFFYELFSQDPKNFKRVVYVHLTAMLLVVGYTVYRHLPIGFVMMGSQLLSKPFYFDHTIYGAALSFFIPFLFHQSFENRNSEWKWLARVFFFIFLPAVFLSYSRAAWLSLIIAMSLYFILKKRRGKKLMYAGLLFVGVFILLNGTKINSFLKNTRQISHTNDVAMHLKSVSNIETDASNRERINRWKCALRMSADKPVFGFGPGTYQFFYGAYQVRQDLTRISTFTGNKGHAHSEYLNYLSETGWPGLFIFLSSIVSSFVCALRLRKKANPESRLVIAILACLLTYFIHAFFNGFLEFDKIAFLVLICLAMLTSLDVNKKPQTHARPDYTGLS